MTNTCAEIDYGTYVKEYYRLRKENEKLKKELKEKDKEIESLKTISHQDESHQDESQGHSCVRQMNDIDPKTLPIEQRMFVENVFRNISGECPIYDRRYYM